MSSPDQLLKLLRALPSENFQYEVDFTRQVVPRLTSILGYGEAETFYEYGGRDCRADVVVSSSIESKPWIVIELKKGRPRSVGDWVCQVQRYLTAFDCRLGVLLSPELLLIIEAGKTWNYELSSLTFEQSIEIQGKLARNLQVTSRIEKLPATDGLSYLIEKVEVATTNVEKGRSLEAVARLLFASVPALICKYANLQTRSSEIDLVIEYNPLKGRLPLFEDAGRYCLVECKNWSKPVGVSPVRDFMGKLDKCKVHLGVIFSKSGVTGVDSGADALREIQCRYDRDGVLLLVFTLEDVRAIDGGLAFVEALDRKADYVRFDTEGG